MINIRDVVNGYKNDFEKRFKLILNQYQRAVIRQLLYSGQTGDMDALLAAMQRRFRIPGNFKAKIEKEISKTQALIAAAWNDYFAAALQPPHKGEGLTPGDYEKMLAAFTVDFPEIETAYNRAIKKEIMRAARADYGFNTLRSRLLARAVPNAWTLANTAVNQFDNAYMTEVATQGGITEFKYDGVLHPNSRKFCKKHLHNIYTIAQLKELDNGQGLPVETSLGGHNCTHYLTPQLKRKKS